MGLLAGLDRLPDVAAFFTVYFPARELRKLHRLVDRWLRGLMRGGGSRVKTLPRLRATRTPYEVAQEGKAGIGRAVSMQLACDHLLSHDVLVALAQFLFRGLFVLRVLFAVLALVLFRDVVRRSEFRLGAPCGLPSLAAYSSPVQAPAL